MPALNRILFESRTRVLVLWLDLAQFFALDEEAFLLGFLTELWLPVLPRFASRQFDLLHQVDTLLPGAREPANFELRRESLLGGLVVATLDSPDTLIADAQRQTPHFDRFVATWVRPSPFDVQDIPRTPHRALSYVHDAFQLLVAAARATDSTAAPGQLAEALRAETLSVRTGRNGSAALAKPVGFGPDRIALLQFRAATKPINSSTPPFVVVDLGTSNASAAGPGQLQVFGVAIPLTLPLTPPPPCHPPTCSRLVALPSRAHFGFAIGFASPPACPRWTDCKRDAARILLSGSAAQPRRRGQRGWY